ncbi:hypothetical protein DM02DRAFT_578528 [Periconia macrospinosa]|uniref:WD40 repeat-like protein n=1 Tax=Periconia macrospinosa TaxID=97972 RepID=A0A2V1ECV5_9PLEO|nr:hypothetical protein DM02DRAFT_578528 [Periconia macrospinosa]
MSDIGIRVRWLASTTRDELERGISNQEGDGPARPVAHNDEQNEEPDAFDYSNTGEDDIIVSDFDNNADITTSSKPFHASHKPHRSCIEEVQLSSDGTCIFTTDHDRHFSVYPIPLDIFSPSPSEDHHDDHHPTTKPHAKPLEPYAQLQSADPIWAFAVNPYFDLSDANTTTVLISRRGHYISLHNALWDISNNATTTTSNDDDVDDDTQPTTKPKTPLNISTPLTSYKLIDPLTEAYLTPLSLTFSRCGAYFYAGHQNTISIYDVSDTYSSPITSIRTIPSARSKLKGGGVGFKGHITALDISPPSTYSHDGILAAGSRTRFVGLYDARSGRETTHFELPGLPTSSRREHLVQDEKTGMGGNGVTQMQWSPDATYLYIAERRSDALLIYDARNFSVALGYCGGRKAMTNQKMGFGLWRNPYEDVYGVGGGSGCEVWAGGTDGRVRVWRDAWKREGRVEADEVVDVRKACGDGGVEDEEEVPVVASLVHASGSLAIVARGHRKGLKWPGRGSDATAEEINGDKEDWGRLDILGLESD